MTGPEPAPAPPRVIPRPLPGRDDDLFWSYLQAGQVRIQQCRACGQWRYPPAPVCARCLSEESQWLPVDGGGTLLSWATFHRRYFPMIDPPYTVVAVQLDEGPIMCADLRGAGPAALELGQRMSLAIEPAAFGDGQACSIFSWQLAGAVPRPGEQATRKGTGS
jgi:uncharacterized protein